ncbi:MAG TPA: DNA polymerase III subunit chi [Caulobacteraceae bacterium]|nr:DNA polymerase III subunit chi [Caulobacteraceae bacterium]
MPSPCEVWFYHLERTSLEQVLPELLEKTLSRGWRARVRTAEPGRIEALDSWLWTYRDDSFLPHGVTGQPFADHQPILLGGEPDNPNGAQALFLLDGEPGDLAGYERCVVIFDGRDEPALQEARALWSRYRKAGHAVTYWRQGGSRGWEKQA